MTIYAVSDATGELAISIATAAIRQFKQEKVSILRRSRVRSTEKITKIIKEARDSSGFIVFTLVSHELRQFLIKAAKKAQVTAVDVMGPVMENLGRFIQSTPSDQPGLKYEFTNDYFRRNEAIEFAVGHDDGLGLETMDQADIILVGVSRTSKTPLSIYLAYRGYKTANVPIIQGVPIPLPLRSVDPKKLVGLTIFPETLVNLRGIRLARLKRPLSEDYANIDAIRQEISYAQKIFTELGQCPVIDVTSKAIEEVASEVLMVLGK